jgi:hypothetical protein
MIIQKGIIIHATKEAKDRYKNKEVPVKKKKTICPSCSIQELIENTKLYNSTSVHKEIKK